MSGENKPAFQKEYERDQAKKLKTAKLFSVDEFIADADKLREAYVPELQCKVQYKKLTLNENSAVVSVEDATERNRKLLYLVLRKADPSVTEDKVGALGNDDATYILRAILADLDFLPKQRAA
jgi:enoyl reductase-like protein